LAQTTMTVPTPQCRFCLEEGDTTAPFNALIAPCECIGSVRFVHRNCLRRWFSMNPEANSLRCSICHAPFKGWAIPVMEEMPQLDSYTYLTFRYFSLIGGIVQYMLTIEHMVQRLMSTEEVAFYRSLYALTVFQLMYAALFIRYFSVRNRILYLKIMRYSTLPTLIMCHLAFLSIFLSMRDIASPYAIYCIMNAYWKEHLRILNDVNIALLH